MTPIPLEVADSADTLDVHLGLAADVRAGLVRRPHYSAGQSLTAESLNGFAPWVESHLRLQQLRHGWGAVCGLGVTLATAKDDTKKEFPVLEIHPGQAVAPDGTNLVVLKPIRKNLAVVCREFLRKPPSGEVNKLGLGDADETKLQFTGTADDQFIELFIPKNEVLSFNVYLTRQFVGKGAAAVASSNCQLPYQTRYEPTALFERGKVVLSKNEKPRPKVEVTGDPLETFLKDLTNNLTEQSLKDWLVNRVRSGNSSGGLPSVKFLETTDAKKLINIHVALLASEYFAWVASKSCSPPLSSFVQLARVGVWCRPSDPTIWYCHIDTRLPYREVYGQTGETPPGAIDLRSYLGAQYNAVDSVWKAFNVMPNADVKVPSVLEFQKLVSQSISFAYPQDELTLTLWDKKVFGTRILNIKKK